MQRVLVLCISLMGVAAAGPAAGQPDPRGALAALARAPATLAGNALGSAGLVGAASLGLAGDAVSAIDHNRLSRPLLHGFASRSLHGLALVVSWSATGALELLRGEDIERLPEAPATYLAAAPTAGRLDTLLAGAGALRLALGDVLAAPVLAVLSAAGARERAARLRQRRHEARVRALGPDPAPTAAPTGMAPPDTGAMDPS